MPSVSCSKCNGLSSLGIVSCTKCHGTGKAKKHKKSTSHGSNKGNKSKPNPKWKDKYNGAKYYFYVHNTGHKEYSVICTTNISGLDRICPERQEFIQLSDTDDNDTINKFISN